ncbi:MAG: hypothetical protein AB9844_03805 [Clostridiaceae bacterium]
MKKLIVVILGLALILTACTVRNSEKDTALNTKTVNDFAGYIASVKDPAKIKNQLDSITREASIKTADALIYKYLKFMEEFVGMASEKYQSELSKLNSYYDLDKESIDPEKIKEGDIKEFYISMTEAGFKFTQEEGVLYPTIDYHFIDSYSKYVSDEMKEFAAFMALDSDNRWAGDAEIRISLTALADRISAAEKYIVKYPDASGKDQVLDKYKIYLGALLGGIDNTPIADYQTGKINDKFIEAYEYFIGKYPELKASEAVIQLNDELKADGYKAPYSYSDYDKRAAFSKHVDALVKAAADKL